MAEQYVAPPILTEVPPELGRVSVETERVLDDVTRDHAARMRTEPALRSLTEVVRLTPDLQQNFVAPFVGRRDEIKDGTYTEAPRVFAPTMTAYAVGAPELVDSALQRHAAQKSERIRTALESLADNGIETYVPVLVVGTGPQSQIFNAQFQQEMAGTSPISTPDALTIERNFHMGGTFRPGEPMGFRVNSRTRPQVDGDLPKPGTRANLNDLRPGVLTPGDVSAETYIRADTFGRVIAINHTFSSDSCLGMKLVGFSQNPAAANGQPGDVSAVLEDMITGRRTLVRTSELVILQGTGDEQAGRGLRSDRSRALINEQQDIYRETGRAQILTVEQFMRMMDDPDVDFPIKDIIDVGIVGSGDGAKVALAKLLGYEPRTDRSTTQLDFVETVTIYGEDAKTLEELANKERLRYVQQAQEFPRAGQPERYSRAIGRPERVVDLNKIVRGNVQLKIDVLSIKKDQTDEENIRGALFDLVILADGYTQDAAKQAQDMVIAPLTGIEAAKILEPTDPRRLRIGDVIEYTNSTLTSLQVVAQNGTTLTMKYTNRSGDYGYFLLDSETDEYRLSGYLNPLIQEVTKAYDPFTFRGFVTPEQYRELSDKEQLELLRPGTIITCSPNQTPKLDFYRVLGTSEDGTRLQTARISTISDQRVSVVEEEFIKDRFRQFVLEDKQTVLQLPYLFDSPRDPEGRFTAVPAQKVGINQLSILVLTTEIPSGSIIFNSARPTRFSILQSRRDPGSGLYLYDYLRCTDGSFRFDSGREGLSVYQSAFDDGYDSIITPDDYNAYLAAEAGVAPQQPLQLNFAKLSATDANGKRQPIALTSPNLPVHIAGPAAQIPVDKELVELIPNIPENPVSVFASAERVRMLARVIAEDVKKLTAKLPAAQRLTIQSKTRPAYIRSPEPKADDAIIDQSLQRKQRLVRIVPRARTLEPKLPATRQTEALLINLGALSREAQLMAEPGKTERISIRLRAGTDGQFIASLSFKDARKLGKFRKRQDGLLNYLLGDPLVADYLGMQLGANPSVSLKLVFDERGLDLRAVQVTTPAKKRRQPTLPQQ